MPAGEGDPPGGRQIPDPRDMAPEQFRGVRDLIEQKVKEVIATL
ncbi:hypothetical protein [Gemmata sp.]